MNKTKTGVILIAEERKEQIEKHGFDAVHDSKETRKQLAQAALYLLMNYVGCNFTSGYFPESWELSTKERFDDKSNVESLRVAGALIAAEIDRILNSKFL